VDVVNVGVVRVVAVVVAVVVVGVVVVVSVIEVVAVVTTQSLNTPPSPADIAAFNADATASHASRELGFTANMVPSSHASVGGDDRKPWPRKSATRQQRRQWPRTRWRRPQPSGCGSTAATPHHPPSILGY
jgi:hypothetical protein